MTSLRARARTAVLALGFGSTPMRIWAWVPSKVWAVVSTSRRVERLPSVKYSRLPSHVLNQPRHRPEGNRLTPAMPEPSILCPHLGVDLGTLALCLIAD